MTPVCAMTPIPVRKLIEFNYSISHHGAHPCAITPLSLNPKNNQTPTMTREFVAWISLGGSCVVRFLLCCPKTGYGNIRVSC